MSEAIDWSTATCPDCGGNDLHEGSHDSDELDDGYCIFCKGCGFEIVGRDEGMIRTALAILMRWKAGQ